jgi:nicotinate phosphoribosyltransferase
VLVADLYELTMATAFHRCGMSGTATFSLFVRRLPARRGFLVAAGVDEAVQRVLDWQMDPEDIRWLAMELGSAVAHLTEALESRFTWQVWAVPDGTVVLRDEPLLEVTAPLAQAQVVESTVLNAVTFQTAVATKAVRCAVAAGGKPVVDFSLRRDHGVEAALAAARAGALAGFTATSNVGAARALGLRPTGTMAHSFVQTFPDERSAFDAFAATFPASPTFLVDTYDTPAGVRAAISVIRDRGLQDRAAVRLDSGDLIAEAKAARQQLDDAGLPGVRIVVSGGVDEYVIDDMRRSRAPADVFAVGTKVGTAADAPLLDSAYKLVQYEDLPITKLSPGKGYPPGPKQVWRRPGHDDILATRDESGPDGATPLLGCVVEDGVRLRPATTLEQAAAHVAEGVRWLGPGPDEIRDPPPRAPRPSDRLARLDAAVRHRLASRS